MEKSWVNAYKSTFKGAKIVRTLNIQLGIAERALRKATEDAHFVVEEAMPYGSRKYVLTHPEKGAISPELREKELTSWIHAFIAGYRWKESN